MTILMSLIALAAVALAVWLFLELRKAKVQLLEHQSHLTAARDNMSALQVARSELKEKLADSEFHLKKAHQQNQAAKTKLAQLQKHAERSQDELDAKDAEAKRADAFSRPDMKGFTARLDDEIKRALRSKKKVTVLVGEVDHRRAFDAQYDEDGREKALAAMLEAVGDVLRRAGDYAARVDETRFAIVMPEADGSIGRQFADRIRKAITSLCLPLPSAPDTDRVTVSIGVTTVPPTRLYDTTTVLRRAEKALQAAQQKGHSQIARTVDAA
ncbi:MAG: GGDEF domain-containing protein [Pseudomonadota bacterium]